MLKEDNVEIHGNIGQIISLQWSPDNKTTDGIYPNWWTLMKPIYTEKKCIVARVVLITSGLYSRTLQYNVKISVFILAA